MVKPLSFKGDKKPKKRKRVDHDDSHAGSGPASSSSASTKQVRKVTGADANDNEDDANDDTWVSADAASDVIGPVMIVLPSEQPCALCCDAGGKVFTMPIENIVDGNPATAEPHDVRQVWVANRISGTDQFRFRGHHGRYLACDKVGLLSALSEAISPNETFNVIATADTPGTFQIQTLRDTFLEVKESRSPSTSAKPDVRGNAEEISFTTTLRIRMQAKYKPKIKSSKEEKALAKISRRELEEAVGRRLEEDEVRILKRARRDGDYHERLMDMRVKNKHDKFS